MTKSYICNRLNISYLEKNRKYSESVNQTFGSATK